MRVLITMAYAVMVWLFFSCQLQAAEVSERAKQALALGHVSDVDLLQAQVKSSSTDYQSWFLLGVAQASEQHFQQAIEAFRKVIELRDDLAEPHNNLAVIYNEMGDVNAAIKELEQSLKKHPGYAIAEENIADLYIKLALKYYKQALLKNDDLALQQRYARLLKVRDTRSKYPAEKVMPTERVSTTKEAVHVVAKEDASSDERLVRAALEAWRDAWQAQDLSAYFDAYADHSTPDRKYSTVAEWKNYKQRVITHKTYIKVTLSDIDIKISKSGSLADVYFRQVFRSNSYNADDEKLLKLEKQAGGWKIVAEEVILE